MKYKMDTVEKTNKKFDLVAIGNAIVDVLSYRSDSFLEKNNLIKGATILLTEKEAETLYNRMGASTECSGGCAANTATAYSMLGGKSALISKVNHDYQGKVFRKSLEKNNVFLHEIEHSETTQTNRCMIIITEEEDKLSGKLIVERTMAACIAEHNCITEKEISEEIISSSKVLFFESYLLDNKLSAKAVEKAINIAKKHNVKIAISLSDQLCVERHRNKFKELINNHINFLFCNELEIGKLYEEGNPHKVIYQISSLCNRGKIELAAITKGPKGSTIITNGEIYAIDAVTVQNIYDITGAGEVYAAGVLYGYLNNIGIEKAGKLGSRCAAQVIKYLGARPLTDISELLENL